MRSITWLYLILVLTASSALSNEETCPASRVDGVAASPFEAFHEVMAPAWHVDWVEENYRGLFAAGEEFSERFKHIAILRPPFKLASRRAVFLENRQNFAQLVKDYASACEAHDSSAVHELMPALHAAFEATAATLLPVYYPEFEAMVITANIISKTHLPQDNMEGLIGSTDKLVRKDALLTAKSVPEEMTEFREQILKEADKFQDTSRKMQTALQKNDRDEFVRQLRIFEELVTEFITQFI